ncbi:unnamed protein product [Caenorhabditis brenneri]
MSFKTESQVLVELPSNYIPEASRRCKVIIVGSANVGKSTFIERIEFGKFNEEKSKEKLYRVISRKIFEQTLTVELVEKSLEEFTDEENGLKSQETRDVDAVIMFYATNDADSFKEIRKGLQYIQRKTPPNASITIVGTKADTKELKVDWHDVDTFAEQQGFSCFETSSKTGVNVEIIMQDILEAIFERKFATDDEEILVEQPIYATTVLTKEEKPAVNGYCWMPKISLFSFFRDE